MTDIELRDEQVAEAIVAGRSLRAVRKEFSLTPAELDAALERLWPVDNQARLRMIRSDLGKLDELAKVFYTKAMAGDVQSSLATVKLWERKHQLLGLDAAQRIDLQVVRPVSDAPTRHEKIRAAIFGLAGRTPPPLVDGNGGDGAVDGLSPSGSSKPSY